MLHEIMFGAPGGDVLPRRARLVLRAQWGLILMLLDGLMLLCRDDRLLHHFEGLV